VTATIAHTTLAPLASEELIALRKIATAIFRGPWATEVGDPDFRPSLSMHHLEGRLPGRGGSN